MLILRVREPGRERHFRTPAIWVIGPLALLGCGFLFVWLPLRTQATFAIWMLVGLALYVLYGYRKSPLASVAR